MDKTKTACFTGHRHIPENEIPQIKKHLEEKIVNLIHQGVIYFGNGGALGFDTLAALAVLKLKEKYPYIKLIMVLPCQNQDKKWDESDRKTYRQLLESADKVKCLSEGYYDGCMQARNLHLVEHSSVCIAYMKHPRSGAAQTVRFARERGLMVVNLADMG